jgi:hypothetical protein
MKSNTLRYRALKAILVGVGKVELHWCPLPFLKKARGFDISGAEQRAVSDILKPGDILVGRYTYHLTGVLIPGRWDHAAIYVGNGQVVHITGKGVSKQDILEFMERDEMAALRLPRPYGTAPDTIARKVMYAALDLLNKGIEYDHLFEFEDATRLSCSELVRECIGSTLKAARIEPAADLGVHLALQKAGFGKMAFTPDDVYNCGLDVIHDSREWRKKQKKGVSV